MTPHLDQSFRIVGQTVDLEPVLKLRYYKPEAQASEYWLTLRFTCLHCGFVMRMLTHRFSHFRNCRRPIQLVGHMNPEPNPPIRKFSWTNFLSMVFFLIVVCLVVFRVYFFRHIPGESNPRANIGLLRFHNEVYYPVRAFITGENPFDAQQLAAFHPDTEYATAAPLPTMLPSTLLIYCLFGFFQLPYAEAIFIALSVLLTVVLSTLLLKKCTETSSGIGGAFFCSALMLASLPGTETFFTCPATMMCVLGVAWSLAYCQRKIWLSSIGVTLAMIQPVIGVPLTLLMLLRGNVAAIAGALALLAITNGLAIGYIIHNGGPELTDLSYWQAFDFSKYTAALPAIGANQSPLSLDLISGIKTWAGNALTLDLSSFLPLVVLVVGGLALWSERAADQRTGIISRSGMLIALLAIVVFAKSIDAMMLLWIPVVGVVVDGVRSEKSFSVGMRFLLGLLLVLPLFNYFATPFLMERLKIGPQWLGDPSSDQLFSLRTALADWNVPNPASVEWNIVSTFNICLIALAALLIMLRMFTSAFFADRHTPVQEQA